MIKCINCKQDCRDGDTFCRTCGIKIESNWHYVLIKIITFIFFLGIIFMILLLIASYYVY